MSRGSRFRYEFLGEGAGEDLCAPDIEMLGIHSVLLLVERRITHQVVESEKRPPGGGIDS